MEKKDFSKKIPFQFKPDVVIGIDPDNKESGVGIVWRETKRVEAFKFSFPKLVDYLRETKNLGQSILIVVYGALATVVTRWQVTGDKTPNTPQQ